jgi:hypothetical protein
MALPWRALLILAPVTWLSGTLLTALGDALRAFLAQPLQDNYAEMLVAVIGALVSAVAVGIVLSLVADALGAARLRALLDVRHAVSFALLASALLWVSLTGLVWANYTGDQFATYTWRVIAGAAYNLFVLVWLIVGVRAAAAVVPLRAAASLLSAAVGCVFAPIGLLILILPLLGDAEPSLPLFGLLVFFGLTILLLPPALLTAGMAALFAGLRGEGPAHSDGSAPPAS